MKQAVCFPKISPDGTLLAYNYLDQQGHRKTIVIPVDGGPPVASLELAQDSEWVLKRQFQWSPDGSELTYFDTRDGVSNIWEQPLAGGASKQLTHFVSDKIFSFAWSRDGSHLAVVRGQRTNDLVEIRLNE